MRALVKPLDEYAEVVRLRDDIARGRFPLRVTGCQESQKCNLMAAVWQNAGSRLIIAPDEQKAKVILQDIRLYDKDALFYPPKDIIFYSADIRGGAIAAERQKCIRRLMRGESVTVVTCFQAGMDKVLPLERLKERVITIDLQTTLETDKLADSLVALGYERTEEVGMPGEFAIRGGLIDIFPIGEETPYRIELWDDLVDSIRMFDAASQRTIENAEIVEIYPAAEVVLSREETEAGLARIKSEADEQIKKLRAVFKTEEAANIRNMVAELSENIEYLGARTALDSWIDYFADETVSFFDYFDSDTSLIFADEPDRLLEAARVASDEWKNSMTGRLSKGYVLPGQMDAVFEPAKLFSGLAESRTIVMSLLDYRFAPIPAKDSVSLDIRSIGSFGGDFGALADELTAWKKKGYRVVLLTGSRSRAAKVAEDLRDRELSAFTTENPDRVPAPGEILVAPGGATRGFEYPLINFAVICETDVFGKQKTVQRRKVYEGGGAIDLAELRPGDYVVHETYGVGIYRGIEMIEVDHVNKDYIKVEYAGRSNLYVRATAMDSIQKYSGPEGRTPKLSRLDNGEWKATKTRVRTAVANIARELVNLYALRRAKEGFVFSEDGELQREFEERFPYEETEDQLKAIADTKKDMESSKIMDRLICGDVGFGKTEIAIRAAYKAVLDGKQVAFLVPTTVLAQQHYNTFVQRMGQDAVRIGMLSRFKTPAEQKRVISDLAAGKLDIVVGTHRLLSGDISFKDLGLLIVDEEQRFGVTHKEKIKQLKGDVDVLTLTATPIPRTLHMSLIGIRDMSILSEAPIDRLPIQTFVMEHNEETIREAIVRELTRGGQVYYVYNRVNSIAEMAASIRRLVPDANIAFAHGKMSERELERVMLDFVNGGIDVLVSTTIIETGLDISNVNTIIIDDADRFGLSQLYQLRGRVGRSSRTAYAFLMYRRDKVLSEVAEERLSAIREFTELGSGVKVAMRDLEIRGAGNLLGAEQSGHMEAVGYDLYCKMLNEAVGQLKDGKPAENEYDTSIDTDIDAYIPSTYIRNEVRKLEMYKRIAAISTEEELSDMQDELTDRFREMPKCVDNLLHVALLKARAHSAYVTAVSQKGENVRLELFARAKLDIRRFGDLITPYAGRLKFVPDKKAPRFEFRLAIDRKKGHLTPDDVFKQLGALFDAMKEIELL